MYAPANSAESPFSSGASQGESQGEIVVEDRSVSTDSPITSLTQLLSQEGEQIEQAAHAPIRSVGPFGEAQNLVGRPTGTHLLIKLLWIQICPTCRHAEFQPHAIFIAQSLPAPKRARHQ
ncbi:hypothetical protein QFC24_003414 [Naganishia onofrii]|uniref:Uncharacterized protein n=1 Tax=Naganishia onofrii TaxID=1851511 RepID=A0ACC2XJT6_9TREE|nr:hypothetical protein QFC24_003414 [Naganishia onofrii]